MLPLPNLDDRLYEQMMQEARQSIPKLLPQWTDENAHDPGITMLELLTWLTEMQQYHLDRITVQNERKFLKLLGVRPREAATASCEVAFAGAEQLLVIPRGTPLRAYDQVFETEETIRLVPAALEKIIVRTDTSAHDLTSNLHAGIAFYAFGPEAAAGSRMYIGFDRELPVDMDIVLSVRLSDRYPVPIGQGADSSGEAPPLVSTSAVSWSYAASDTKDGWAPLSVTSDTTRHMLQSGQIVFRLDGSMQPIALHPADDRKRYWLCCELLQGGYELAPKPEYIGLNAVRAVQRETLSETLSFQSDGKRELVCENAGYWAFFGDVEVQVGEEPGNWRIWNRTQRLVDCVPGERSYELHRDSSLRTLRLVFGGEGRGAVPAAMRPVRLIASDPSRQAQLWVGESSGLPGQQFDLSRSGPFRIFGMGLQVARRDAAGETVWEDWVRVDDFDNSLPTDRHFTYDRAQGLLCFGDNERGAIPERSDAPNIRFVSLQIGGGTRGNIKKEQISAFVHNISDWSGLTLTNPAAADGGSEEESLREAKLRAQRELGEPTRAVTAEDYEAIARQTPGLRVARVIAIPLYRPGLRDYPREKEAGQMTVVVVPYSEQERPQASSGFLETVRRYLEQYRLLGTELHVMSAAYIRVTVHAVVVVEQGRKEDAPAAVSAVLRRLLRPMGHGDGEGWRFGRSVYKGDIYGAISQVKGVVYVQDLWIDAEGSSVQKDGSGDIHLPPHGLVYSGEHGIETIGVSDL